MNHPITIGGLLLAIGVFAGFVGAFFGVLMIFAEGMSDAASASSGKGGCLTAVIGAAVCFSCLWGLLA